MLRELGLDDLDDTDYCLDRECQPDTEQQRLSCEFLNKYVNTLTNEKTFTTGKEKNERSTFKAGYLEFFSLRARYLLKLALGDI